MKRIFGILTFVMLVFTASGISAENEVIADQRKKCRQEGIDRQRFDPDKTWEGILVNCTCRKDTNMVVSRYEIVFGTQVSWKKSDLILRVRGVAGNSDMCGGCVGDPEVETCYKMP